jgi:hypothetical protein
MTRNRVVLPPRTCQSKSLTGCAHCLTHLSTIKPHAVFHQTLQPTCHDATPEEAVTSASGAGADGALGAEGSPVRTGADTADTGLVPTAVTTDARKKYVVDAVRPMTRITSPADVDDTCKLCKRHEAPRQRGGQRWAYDRYPTRHSPVVDGTLIVPGLQQQRCIDNVHKCGVGLEGSECMTLQITWHTLTERTPLKLTIFGPASTKYDSAGLPPKSVGRGTRSTTEPPSTAAALATGAPCKQCMKRLHT